MYILFTVDCKLSTNSMLSFTFFVFILIYSEIYYFIINKIFLQVER